MLRCNVYHNENHEVNQMKYLTLRNGWYIYNRRVPNCYKEFDTRQRIRIALNTKCEKVAMKQLLIVNDEVENYWKLLVKEQETHSIDKYKRLVTTAKQLGFTYVPSSKLTEIPWEDFLSRFLSLKNHIHQKELVEVVAGTDDQRQLPLSEALERFWQYSKPLLITKTPNQQRIWKNPRKKAVHNFIKQVGDKNIFEITNLDMIALRDWWLERVQSDNIKADTVNKDFTHLKGILETVNTHEQLNMDIDVIFKNIYLKEDSTSTRLPFETDFIINELLNDDNLTGIEDEAKYILYAMAETGARPIELLNLNGEDIFLNEDIPHIYIRPRKGYSLKTKDSQRKIPLIGYALKAFRKYPNGFSRYRDKSSQFSHYINAFLREKKLRPTLDHTLYSLRHSFQDRLTEHEIPDRIQCQLMGHSFKAKGRVTYGKGASLKHLNEVMKRISLYDKIFSH